METRTNVTPSLDHYAGQINRWPLLTREQEQELARRYRATGDTRLAERLVLANLRFVLKIAHEYRGYELPLLDLVQEGNLGLMNAVAKFDPHKGYRLISYAVWWIRAYIQNYVIRSWSLVKVGTTQGQRKLFFKLRSERDRAEREGDPRDTVTAAAIAERLGVSEIEVETMEARLAARDYSLDAGLAKDERLRHMDIIVDGEPTPEEEAMRKEDRKRLRERLTTVMELLNERERYIVEHRLMSDEPKTLHEIGAYFSISRERARQIEGSVTRKLKLALCSPQNSALPLAFAGAA